jgi:exonuclease III
MRIVSWNCNGALRKKLGILLALDADIYVVQECEDPAHSTDSAYREWAHGSLWAGANKHKGMGVFSRNARLSMLDWESNELELFLPFTANEKLTVLAVWTRHGNSRTFRYIGQIWKYMQSHKNKLLSRGTIFLGDFNSNTCWDAKREHNHTVVVRELSEIGLESAYHLHTAEQQGKESQPTFFMYRNPSKPYHIDYAFASSDILSTSSISIGSPSDWLEFSDHMPVVLDFA